MKNFKALLFVGAVGLTATTTAHSADGCKFMLCMGAVNPMGIPECVGTIKEVMRDLRKGRGFPTCKMSNGLDSRTAGSWIDHKRASYIPACPSGMVYGSDKVHYHVGAMPQSPNYRNVGKGLLNEKNPFAGDKDNVLPAWKDDYHYASRVCVGGSKLGSAVVSRVYMNDGSVGSLRENHEWWEKVQVVKPDGALYNFKFFVDGKLFSQHRF